MDPWTSHKNCRTKRTSRQHEDHGADGGRFVVAEVAVLDEQEEQHGDSEAHEAADLTPLHLHGKSGIQSVRTKPRLIGQKLSETSVNHHGKKIRFHTTMRQRKFGSLDRSAQNIEHLPKTVLTKKSALPIPIGQRKFQ